MPTHKIRKSKTDWARVGRLRDADIRRAAKADPDAAPIAGAEWFRWAKRFEPQAKSAISMRLDDEVLKWFRSQGRGYQTRINAVLRAYVESQL